MDLVSEKQLFVIGNININSLDYECNNIVKNLILMLCLKTVCFQLLNDPLELQGTANRPHNSNRPHLNKKYFLWNYENGYFR